jgi:hypothetical protein
MRDLIEPGIKADQIDGNGGEKMLEMRFRQAQIARAWPFSRDRCHPTLTHVSAIFFF